MQAQPPQEAICARQLHNEVLAVVELSRDELTMRAVHARRESLHQYLKKHIPTPIPSGKKNILNKRYEGLTQLHGSVMFLKHDITDLLLEHGANVNINEQGQTIAHRAAAANDTLMLHTMYSHGGDFSLLNHDGETPLMIPISLGNMGAVKEILKYCWNVDNFFGSNETILHYAARHDNPEIALNTCDPQHRIKINQRSTQKLQIALHLAVKESTVEITSILLENGARDEWGDCFGMLAREYIRNDNIGVLFKRHKFSLNYN
jgi:ankyrin repeat protein